MGLSEPGAEALSASRALGEKIKSEIVSQSGWISFARYMELVLYTPRLGYYSGGAAKIGAEGDFTTAPEMTTLFGRTLARALSLVLTQTKPCILEFGAGTGKLAYDLLSELNLLGVVLERYLIIELSGELRDRQKKMLRHFPQVEWLDQLPTTFSGVMIGNEVLDAMPVHLVVKTENGWQERGVGLSHQTEFMFSDRAAASVLQEYIQQHIPDMDALPIGYVTELHLVATGFMRALAQLGKAAGQSMAALFIDYGFPAQEYFHPQRTQGTLMCHYRHRVHDDPFYVLGLQDITAHVDFSAIALSAQEEGLNVLSYLSQAHFLLNAGMGALLLQTSPEKISEYGPQVSAMQKLVSPAEMGELFKVLVVGKGVQWPESLASGDRRNRL